ncbi:hypothetical protein HPB52_017712 [Rhipicephalus sanguineus]|uniref:Uncharacterized protein n=1 Tax=Rhipicephalus sanguineus TaxID=34632 RepID=A0A9D4Q1F7_RHISA|nr:hypothetical protein HPB52_017712 [Rhipicephalus sanguineus]
MFQPAEAWQPQFDPPLPPFRTYNLESWFKEFAAALELNGIWLQAFMFEDPIFLNADAFVLVDPVLNVDASEDATRKGSCVKSQWISSQMLPPMMGLAVFFSLGWVLEKLGFGKRGIKPGSLAAAYHAFQRSPIQKSGAFSVLQSWGVKGIPTIGRMSIGFCTFYICYIVLAVRLIIGLLIERPSLSESEPTAKP